MESDFGIISDFICTGKPITKEIYDLMYKNFFFAWDIQKKKHKDWDTNIGDKLDQFLFGPFKIHYPSGIIFIKGGCFPVGHLYENDGGMEERIGNNHLKIWFYDNRKQIFRYLQLEKK